MKKRLVLMGILGKAMIITLLVFGLMFIGCKKATDDDDTGDGNSSKKNTSPLILGKWTDGNLAVGGEQWFSFIANAPVQYIHVTFGSLTSLDVQVYDGADSPVGTKRSLYGSTGTTDGTNQSVMIGQTYYVRVQPDPYGLYGSRYGTYKIAFSRSNSASFEEAAAGGATPLTPASWTDGNLASGGVQWFSFTANVSVQYIHVTFGSLTSLDVQVYDGAGSPVGTKRSLYGSTGTTNGINQSVTIGQTYYVWVQPDLYGLYGSRYGTYKIAFNTP